MGDEDGVKAATEFLKRSIDAMKVRDELESFGAEDLSRVVRIAKKLGYEFTEEHLVKALAGWDQEFTYLKKFCLSEPPGF